jgi:hypothetical protein
MPLDPAFVADCPYGPEGLLIDELLAVDHDRQLVRARMPTSDALPLTSAQRAHPIRHPRHVSGGLMVHMTGMMGFLHAYYLLDLRHESGWIGYGGKIYSARFRALAPPGEPLVLECASTQTRRGDTSIFARYSFRFTQMQRGVETVIYEGDQAAFWTNVYATRSDAARELAQSP